jgi:hypothetical protein
MAFLFMKNSIKLANNEINIFAYNSIFVSAIRIKAVIVTRRSIISQTGQNGDSNHSPLNETSSPKWDYSHLSLVREQSDV